MTSKTLAVLFALLLASYGCGQEQYALSDSQAKDLFEKIWATQFQVLPLGQLSAIGGPAASLRQPNRQQGEVSQEDLSRIRVLDQMGVVKLTVLQDLSKGFTNWNDWMALTQSGIQIRFAVAPTAQAKALQCSAGQRALVAKIYGNREGLCVLPGVATVERIVSNEARVIGADHYRVVMGNHTWESTPIVAEVERREGKQQSRERKFMVALKYDPFSSEWKTVAIDLADHDKEFSTHSVSTLLGGR